jgi:hypothetical protein
MKFRDLKLTDKLLISIGAGLIVLSLSGLVIFVPLSVFSLLTWSAPRAWGLCFLLCAVSLGGWMFLYSGQLRFGGGVMLSGKNLLLLFSLIVAVLTSTVITFPGRAKYLALLALGLALVAFNVAVPGITSPRMFKYLKNARTIRRS